MVSSRRTQGHFEAGRVACWRVKTEKNIALNKEIKKIEDIKSLCITHLTWNLGKN